MKTKLLIGWALTVLSTGVLASCSDDEEPGDPPAAGKGGSAGSAGTGSSGKGGTAGTGGGKAGDGGKGGTAGSAGGKAGDGGKGGGGSGGVAGSTAGTGADAGMGGAGGDEGGAGGADAGMGGAGGDEGGAGGEGGATGGTSGTAGTSGTGGAQGGTAGGGTGGIAGGGTAGGGTAGGGTGGTAGGGTGGTAGGGTGGSGGSVPVAELRLNELNPNIASGSDSIELRVIAAGNIAGLTVEQAVGTPVLLATLPSLVVAVDDLIVVHLDAPAGITTESTGKAQCTVAACYDLAWDVVGEDAGLAYANRVIAVLEGNEYQDAVPFVTNGMGTAFLDDLEDIQTAGQWSPVSCDGDPCTYTSDPTALEVSVDWTDTETGITGDSVQVTATNNNNAGAWDIAASTFGEPND